MGARPGDGAAAAALAANLAALQRTQLYFTTAGGICQPLDAAGYLPTLAKEAIRKAHAGEVEP